jgi:hypothetical protein
MRYTLSAASLAMAMLAPPLSAQDAGQTITATMPVYSKIVAFPLPEGFESAYENEQNGSYLLEFVPSGESVENWTQMISMTGSQDLVASGKSALDYGSILGTQFKSACPDSFRAWDEGEVSVKGADAAHLFLFACGDLGEYSEMAAILVAYGGQDAFTLQWAERGAPVPKPESDPAIWSPRAQSLLKLRLCEIVPGEEPPYPSCVE